MSDDFSGAAEEFSRLTDEQKEKLFEEAREWLRSNHTVKESEELFSGEISPSTVSRLRGRTYHSFTPVVRLALIKVYRPEQRMSAYEYIRTYLGLTDTAEDVLANYKGKYRYYRITAPNGDEPIYSSGTIRIYADFEGKPTFEHRSSSHLKKAGDSWQHLGFVFVNGERLFFAGAGEGTMTMWIAETYRAVPQGNPKAKEVLHGVSLSTRATPRDPFAARFLLVSNANHEWQKKLDPESADGEECFRAVFDEREKVGANFVKTR